MHLDYWQIAFPHLQVRKNAQQLVDGTLQEWLYTTNDNICAN